MTWKPERYSERRAWGLKKHVNVAGDEQEELL
jgi:hypothetical protein